MTDIHWGVVEDEIERSVAHKKGERIRWADYFGESLNKAVARYLNAGMSPNRIYDRLHLVLAHLGVSDRDVYRKLRIGVSARVGETKSRESIKKNGN